MKIYLLIIVLNCIYLFIPVRAEEDGMTEKQKIGYAMGVFFAQSIPRQDIDMDVDYFIDAVSDILNNNQPKLSDDEIRTIFLKFQQQEQQSRAQQAAANKQTGKDFLAGNRTKEGVVELNNGLQYKVLRPGNGPNPEADGEVTVHYRGTLLNGNEFDSSYSRNEPAKLSLNQVIQGWQQALPLMKTGALWEIYIPSELAYGPAGAGAIGPDETLIFEIELIEVH